MTEKNTIPRHYPPKEKPSHLPSKSAQEIVSAVVQAILYGGAAIITTYILLKGLSG